jgi:hypothetical protein
MALAAASASGGACIIFARQHAFIGDHSFKRLSVASTAVGAKEGVCGAAPLKLQPGPPWRPTCRRSGGVPPLVRTAGAREH